MTTVQSDKVKTVTFHGGGDDLDKPIKDIRNDSQFQSMISTNFHPYGDL